MRQIAYNQIIHLSNEKRLMSLIIFQGSRHYKSESMDLVTGGMAPKMCTVMQLILVLLIDSTSP